jgi:hypothetical protein
MLNFAKAVGRLIADIIDPSEVERVFREYHIYLDPIRFKESVVLESCKQFCRCLDVSEDMANIDVRSLDKEVNRFLVNLVCKVSNCNEEHLKECEGHKAILIRVFDIYLALLCGIDLEKTFAELKAVISTVSADELVVQPMESYNGMAASSNWGTLMTDPEVLARVAEAMSELSKDVQVVALRTLSHTTGLSKTKPTRNELEKLIKSAVLGARALN